MQAQQVAWALAAAMVATIAALTLGPSRPAAKPLHVAQASSDETAARPLVPPVPRPARRPVRAAGVPAAEAPPLIPPVPRPAIRPQRLAAASSTEAPLIPPVPQRLTRQQWLAALSEGERVAPHHVPRPADPPHRNGEEERMRACLKPAARALLERIEAAFGPVKIVSTCRPGARIAASGRMSKHATGEAIDFDAGQRKAEVVRWLVANHSGGGTMTYADMSHIHVDVGQHFVALGARSGR
jgi:peptidase M15-like protein